MKKSRYHKDVPSTCIDVYDVLKAFDVRCPARQHAIKKLLMPGARGTKTEVTDLREALQSVERAIELAGQDEVKPDARIMEPGEYPQGGFVGKQMGGGGVQR